VLLDELLLLALLEELLVVRASVLLDELLELLLVVMASVLLELLELDELLDELLLDDS